MMKTEKIIWGNPILDVQLFVPQDCVAACSQITDQYFDFDKDGQYDDGEELEFGYFYSGSERTYYNINTYSNRQYRNGRYYYTGTVKSYSIVDIRYEGRFILWSLYKPYNATS